MADRKITDLTALAAGSQATGDLLTIVDVSEAAAADKNKKITVESLFKGIPSNVGIGTSSPGRQLQINGDSDTQIRVVASAGGSAGIQFGDADDSVMGGVNFDASDDSLQLRGFNNSERMRIDSDGNVGIGTASNLLANSTRRTLSLNHTGSSAVAFGVNGTREGHIYVDNDEMEISAQDNFMYFTAGSSERMRIDSSGNVGIGETSPNKNLVVKKANGGGDVGIRIQNDSTDSSGTTASLRFTTSTNDSFDTGSIVVDRGTGAMIFSEGEVEAMRIDNQGRLLVGGTASTHSDAQARLQVHSAGATNIVIARNDSTISAGNTIGMLQFYGNDGGTYQQCAEIRCDADLDHANNDKPSRLVFGTTADGASSATERMRINSSGRVGIGTTSPAVDLHVASTNARLRVDNTGSSGIAALELIGGNQTNPFYLYTDANRNLIFQDNSAERMRISSDGDLLIGQSSTDTPGFGNTTLGAAFENLGSDGVALFVSRSNNIVAGFNRAQDGTIIDFNSAGNTEGSVSISGSTTSFNGGHLARWTQLAGNAERIEILRGSVLSNLDEMCEWGEEDNEQLNRMKVSDVEGDVNVSGVFQAWDDDDDTYTNDFYCAMTGDFVIRIAQGTTVARGDLLMSAGDGTAKPQDDDIVRSKTIAKVTSTTVSTTYADGSYCVPCVLMAC